MRGKPTRPACSDLRRHLSAEDGIRLETTWMDRLATRAYGLNP